MEQINLEQIKQTILKLQTGQTVTEDEMAELVSTWASVKSFVEKFGGNQNV